MIQLNLPTIKNRRDNYSYDYVERAGRQLLDCMPANPRDTMFFDGMRAHTYGISEWIAYFESYTMVLNDVYQFLDGREVRLTDVAYNTATSVDVIFNIVRDTGGCLQDRDMDWIVALQRVEDNGLSDIAVNVDIWGPLEINVYGLVIDHSYPWVLSTDEAYEMLYYLYEYLEYEKICIGKIQQQSGEFSVKEYNMSKYESHCKNKHKAEKHVIQKIHKIEGRNCGSAKKKNIASLRKKAAHIKEQSGFCFWQEDGRKSMDDFLSKVGLTGGLTESNIDSAILIGEKMLLQYFAMTGDKNMKHVMLSMLAVCPFSFTGLTINFLKKFLSRYGDSLKDISLKDFVDKLRNLSFNWDMLKKNKHLRSFISFVSMVFTCILCPSIPEVFSPAYFGKFVDKVTSFFFKNDLIEGILSTFLYITNAISVLVRTGSIQGFITTDEDLDLMQNKYLELIEIFPNFKRGDEIDYNEFEYLHDLEDLILQFKKILPGLFGQQASQVRMMLTKLSNCRSESFTMEANRGIRASPFTFELFSGTGISKTYITKLILASVLGANDYPFTTDYIYTLNDADKYYSGWKNYMTGVILDDMENTRPDFQETNLQAFLLKACNNQPHNLVAADIDDKGVLFNRSACIGISTNNPHLNFEAKTQFVSASERRVHYKILGKVKPEYCKRSVESGGQLSCMIDYDLIPPEQKYAVNPDAWLYDVFVAEIVPNSREFKDEFGKACPRSKDDQWKWTKIHVDIDTEDLIRIMITASGEHFRKQAEVVKSSKRLDKITFCEHKMVSQICTLCTRKPSWDDVMHELLTEEVDLNSDTQSMEDYCLNQLFFDEFVAEDPPAAHVSEQSGSTKQIRYLKNIVHKMESLNTETGKQEFSNLILAMRTGKEGWKAFYDLLSDWTDALMSKFIIGMIERLFKYIEPYVRRPTDLIPADFEGKIMGTYLHGQRKVVQAVGIMDWSLNFLNVGRILSSSRRWMPCTAILLWLMKFSRKLKTKRILPDCSISSYVEGTATAVSEFNCEVKKEEPNAFRDKIFPVATVMLFFTSILPNFATRLFGDYVEEQSGMIVPEDGSEDWYKHKVFKVQDVVPVTKRSTPDELNNIIANNLVTMLVKKDGRGFFCQGLMLCTGIILLPRHEMLKHIGCVVTFIRKQLGPNQAGNAKFECPVGESNMYKVPNHDLVCLKCPDTGPVRDIIEYFPSDYYKPKAAKVWYRTIHGELKNYGYKVIEMSMNVATNYDKPNITYPALKGEGSSFFGLCGAPWIGHGVTQSYICGIHLAGDDAVKQTVGVMVLRQDIKPIVDNVVKLVLQGSFKLESYGNNLFEPVVHPKSPLLHIPDIKNVRVLGSINKRVSITSNVIKTKISDDVKKAFNVKKEWSDPPIYGPTGNDKRYPYKNFLNNYLKAGAGPPADHIEWAKNDYRRTLFAHLDKDRDKWKDIIRPLDEEEMFSGIDGVKFVNGMNMSTSTGKYLPGKKSAHAEFVDGKWKPNDYILEDIRNRDCKLRAGYRSNELLSAYPKIEPTERTKIDEGKVRIFFGANIATQALLRKYFLSTTRFFCTQTEVTECAVGVNPHSTSWNAILEHLDKVKGKNYFAFDFKRFDMSISATIMDAAMDILIDICKWTGNYSEEDIKALYGLKHELLYNLVDLNGDLVQLIGLLLSGVSITSILGCIVNSLYLRISFREIFSDHKTILAKGFQHWVKLCTFGDDSIGKVHKALSEFNVDNVVKILNLYSVWTTNCFKDERKVKFVKLDDLEFLKRRFIYNREMGTYVCALDENSIFKSLSAILKPKIITEEVVLGQNIDGALFEMKFYGRKKYEFYRRTLKEIAIKHGLEMYCNNLEVSYDEMVKEWKDTYLDQNKYDWFWFLWPFSIRDIEHSKVENYGLSITSPQANTTGTPSFGFEEQGGKNLAIEAPENKIKSGYSQPENEKVSAQLMARITEQSGSHPAVEFLGPPGEQQVQFGSNVAGRTHDEKIELDDFFARPVKISSLDWGATSGRTAIYPWKLYMDNVRVSNRLANYNLLKGNLHVKAIVNGNGFFYGRMMASYEPFEILDELSTWTGNEVELVSMSCMPHAFINPTLSEGFEMDLPFLWYYDYFSLPTDDPRDFGTLMFNVINPLKHANADIGTVPQTISVTIYAWMTEVECVGLTVTNPSFMLPQSGEFKIKEQSGEEKTTVDKPISQAATNVANAASILKTVPIISPYMTALEKGAQTVSAVASALGYSRPTGLEEPCKYTPRVGANLAATNTTDTCQTLATDVKQGLSISSKDLGLQGIDELSIGYLASREAYYFQFQWSHTQLAGDLLQSIKVDPQCFRSELTPSPGYYLTPVAGCTIPFELWTGTLKYRFSVVSSAYHRGRLGIVYDSNEIRAAREDNVQFTQIVDISDNTDFTIEVSNHQSRGYLDCSTNIVDKFSSGPQVSADSVNNGVIGVYIVNELTTPNYDATVDTAISINVYVSAGDDFRLASPSGTHHSWTVRPQSGTFSPDRIDHDNPVNTESDFKITTDLPVEQEKVYIGERIDSFRALMKRYEWYDTYLVPSGAVSPWIRFFTRSIYPAYHGLMASGQHVTSLAAAVNYNPNTIQSYMRPAFSCMKGGTRNKFVRGMHPGSQEEATIMTVTRDNGRPAGNGQFLRDFSTESKTIYSDRTFKTDSGCGSNFTDSSLNPILDVEFPYYAYYKFIPGKRLDYSNGLIHRIPSYILECTTSTVAYDVRVYSAVSEDFNLFMFTGWPKMYNVTLPVA